MDLSSTTLPGTQLVNRAMKLVPDTVFGLHAAAALVAVTVVDHHIEELIRQIMVCENKLMCQSIAYIPNFT